MKILKNFFVLSIILLLCFSSACESTDGDFKMKSFDKAYITFVFDDTIMPFTAEVYEMFEKFDMPMCCAVIAQNAYTYPEIPEILKKVEDSGGEILSHTFDHRILHKDNCNPKNYKIQFEDSYYALIDLGFVVDGIIEAGDGGKQKTANYEDMEPYVRKFYKYSNAYGVSPQYNKVRIWFQNYTIDQIKEMIDSAVIKKEWIVLSAHDFNDVPKEYLQEVLNYIDSLGKEKVETVTWRHIYNTFGVYTGPSYPSKEVIEYLEILGTPDQKEAILGTSSNKS